MIDVARIKKNLRLRFNVILIPTKNDGPQKGMIDKDVLC